MQSQGSEPRPYNRGPEAAGDFLNIKILFSFPFLQGLEQHPVEMAPRRKLPGQRCHQPMKTGQGFPPSPSVWALQGVPKPATSFLILSDHKIFWQVDPLNLKHATERQLFLSSKK